MFRKSAYEQAGGYRPEFYFGQDSDLWLRIGELGSIAYLPERLYLFRVSEHGLGARWSESQARLGELSHVCQQARRAGVSEEAVLSEARKIRPALLPAKETDPKGAAGLWFLSRCLLQNGDRRGLKYAWRYVRCRPGELKGWLSAIWGIFSTWHREATFKT